MSCLMASVCFFFFSSRRRHTRCSRDWSSDVCSSDLIARNQQVVRVDREKRRGFTPEQQTRALAYFESLIPSVDAVILEDYGKGLLTQTLVDTIIGRARAARKIVTLDPKPSNPIRWHD